MVEKVVPFGPRIATWSLSLVAVSVLAACGRVPLQTARPHDASATAGDASSDVTADRPPVLGDASLEVVVGADAGPDLLAADADGATPDTVDRHQDSAPDRTPPVVADVGADADAAFVGEVAFEVRPIGPDGRDLPSGNLDVSLDGAYDTGQDGRVAAKDGGRDAVSRDAGAEHGSPGRCSGTLVPGVLPMAQVSGYDQESIAIADLNGDGKPDVVSAGRSMSVLLGKGGGIFAARTDYALASSAAAMVLGDLNGDGKLDIVTAEDSSNALGVLLGKGDGTFGAEVQYATGNLPRVLLSGDLNNDGKLDLVVGSSTVSVLLGNGDGTLAPGLDYATRESPRNMALGDLNGDGKLDLVAAIGGSPITLTAALGNGDGTFAASRDLPLQDKLGLDGAPVALGDLNGDGVLDIVVAVAYTGQVSVLVGNGDGTFAEPTVLSTRAGTAGVLLRDLNGDGNLDLVTGGSSVRVSLGRGDGSFGLDVTYPFSARLLALATADVNGDGSTDIGLAVNDGNRDWVDFMLGRGDGSFTTSQPLTYPTSARPQSIVLGDLNRDGNLDLVTASPASVDVLLGTGDGSFSAEMELPDGAKSIALGDLDRDGILDMVAVDAAGVGVMLGAGDGKLAAKIDYPTDVGPSAVALGDLNGDGVLDVVTTNGAGSFKGTVSVLLGSGGGELGSHAEYSVGVSPVAVALGDLNRDGKLDIAVANIGIDDYWSISVLLGNGDGTFAAETEYGCGYGPNSIALGDLNGDGKLDIVVANSTAATSVNVLLGNGDGTFAADVEYITGDRPHSVVLADMDGDGKLDVVTANRDSGTFSVLLGNGDGTFAAAVDYAFAAETIAAADVNGDGRLDLVTDRGVLLGECR